MPDATSHPLLLLPRPTSAERKGKGGGGAKLAKPSRSEQARRLGPELRSLTLALEQKRLRLQAGVSGIVPEEVLVLETAGPVQNFLNAVRKIEELEWMAEWDRDFEPDEYFQDAKSPEKVLGGRLYLVLTTDAAIKDLLALWNLWEKGQKLPTGFAPWGEAFTHLKTIRFWNAHDRMEATGVLEDWERRIESGAELVPAEVELWFRAGPERRARAAERVRTLVVGCGGRVVQVAAIEEIHYHGLLVEIPRSEVRRLDEIDEVDLFLCEQVQFFRPVGQMVAPSSEESTPDATEQFAGEVAGEPVAALLDGLPLENHDVLAGRLLVDDPDGWASGYPAARREHGTCMASLIVQGDLERPSGGLPRPLYVRPIMQPVTGDYPGTGERCPEDQLLVDLVHRAVRRMFVGDGGSGPVAPTIKVINFSIGDRDRPYDHMMSPLARLLDWLSWEHKVLFVVSAGNQRRPIDLDTTRPAFEALAPPARADMILSKTREEHIYRRILSPGESINALTVGATYSDHSSPTGAGTVFVLPGGIPAPYTRQGPGYRGIIKPDLVIAGGRLPFRIDLAAHTKIHLVEGVLAPGHKSAAPGPGPGQRNRTRYSRGTSNAAALLTRQGARFTELLASLRRDPGGQLLDEVPESLFLKVLLVHGARWPDECVSLLTRIFGFAPESKEGLTLTRRFTGYGLPNFERVAFCTDQRVTALSGGALEEDQGHVHSLPLPTALSGQRGKRRVTVTLAYFTPVQPGRREYSVADLWFKIENRGVLQLEGAGADFYAVERGTVQHTIFEGERAKVFDDEESLNIQVSCRSQAGPIVEPIPYALAVTLEVAPKLNLPIYSQVRERLRLRIRPQE